MRSTSRSCGRTTTTSTSSRSAGPRRAAPARDGGVEPCRFRRECATTSSRLLSRPNYSRVDGRPRFSIYEIGNFISGLGGISQTRYVLLAFEEKARAAGHAGVHIDLVVWSLGILPGAVTQRDPLN